jgi:hypothetical protein
MRDKTNNIDNMFLLLRTYIDILEKLEKLYGTEFLEKHGFLSYKQTFEAFEKSVQAFHEEQSAGPRFSG